MRLFSEKKNIYVGNLVFVYSTVLMTMYPIIESQSMESTDFKFLQAVVAKDVISVSCVAWSPDGNYVGMFASYTVSFFSNVLF